MSETLRIFGMNVKVPSKKVQIKRPPASVAKRQPASLPPRAPAKETMRSKPVKRK